MIGYYVHHVGRGHLDRAVAVAQQLRQPVTALSSLPRPASWTSGWIELPRDDDGNTGGDPTASGRLHWAPLGHPGHQSRMAAVASWIAEQRPSVFVADLSAEVTVLARLCGVPVVTTVLPGVRNDSAHQLAFELADAIVAPWPALDAGMCVGLYRHAAKVRHVGGMSRFDRRPAVPSENRSQCQVLIFGGLGGTGDVGAISVPPRLPDGWKVTRRTRDNWVDDPWPDLCAADVVIAHCGLGALSDLAAARRPAVLVPEVRPHDEQCSTARALADSGIAVVLAAHPSDDEWLDVLDRAMGLDVDRWSLWSDGRAAARMAGVISSIGARR